jgi:hypothetical protein
LAWVEVPTVDVLIDHELAWFSSFVDGEILRLEPIACRECRTKTIASVADSDEVAQAFRDDLARCSDMMSPGERCLAGEWFLSSGYETVNIGARVVRHSKARASAPSIAP